MYYFDPSLIAFLHRFAGSGRANRRLASVYHVDLSPRPFTPVVGTPFYRLLAKLQWFALRWGYTTARRTSLPSSRCIPWPEEAWEEQERGRSQDQGTGSKDDVALFIDGDNISADAFGPIWKTATGWGPIRFCGVYCQHPSPKWERVRQEYPLITVCGQAGKETDSILIQDAETWAHTSSLRRFCLVSNDGDFAKLAERLKQAGEVLGIGMQGASDRLKRACSRFVTLSTPKKTAS